MLSVATATAIFANDREAIAGIYPDVETAWETVTNAIATGLEKVFGFSLEEALEFGLLKRDENKWYRWVGLMPEVKSQCPPEVVEKFWGVWGFGFIDHHTPEGAFKTYFSNEDDGAYRINFVEETI